MRFPKSRLKWVRDWKGKDDPGGFITLEVTALDLEGVNTIVISVEEIEAAKLAGDKAGDKLAAAKKLLGG